MEGPFGTNVFLSQGGSREVRRYAEPMTLERLIQVINVLGLVAFTVSGVLEARRKHMDALGACVVAFATAFGGGTLRDLLLGRLPVFWVKDEVIVIVCLGVALIAFYATRTSELAANAILIPDALGLGFFAVLGTTIALESGSTVFIASLMGMITAVFGGVVRDVICNEIPVIFGRTQLYATCALAGSWSYLGIRAAGGGEPAGLVAGVAVAFLLRVLAIRFDVKLPPPRAS